MNFAYLSHIKINTKARRPIYQQLRDALGELIISGIMPVGHKLPSSRLLSDHFNIHRQTVVTAINELLAEGWLVSVERKGIFVNNKLPQLKPKSFGKKVPHYPEKAAFAFHQMYPPTLFQKKYLFGFDDGYPDIRIAPYKELGKAYAQTLAENSNKNIVARLAGAAGSSLLREELAAMMRAYRGLAIGVENILLTHGSQMSIFLVANRLLSNGDNVIVTKPNYLTANNSFIQLGAKLLFVDVDANGMNVEQVEAHCKKKKIRFLYVTSHHHHPTTVTLSVDRRMKLLQLAHKYDFAIIEDDYDYDFHYENKPLLPIASNDKHGSVVYIGSFSKILSQTFRVGYIIAPADFIKQLGMYRRIVDRQGDQVLEDALGKMFRNNVIKNHIRKATNIYRDRRDRTHAYFKNELSNFMQCGIPEGGLAFWAHFEKGLSLEKIAVRCAAKGLFFPDGSTYNYDRSKINACRLGFASMNEMELHKAIDILSTEIKKIAR